MKYSFALLSDFSAEELSLTEKMLSESEKLRLSAKPREKYVQSLAVRTLLKKLLDKSGIYMTDFCVDRATCGKPLLISPEGLYISFSHSEDMVACVFSYLVCIFKSAVAGIFMCSALSTGCILAHFYKVMSMVIKVMNCQVFEGLFLGAVFFYE